MTDQYEHNIGDHEDPRASSTWLIGFIGALLVVVTMLGVTALYYNVKASKVEEVVVDEPLIEVKKARIRQEQLITGHPRWVEVEDVGGGVRRELAIPIDRAMQLIVDEYAATEGETGSRP